MNPEIKYWNNGNVRSIIERNDEDQYHGECKWFDKDGQLWEHSFYENNKRHGERKWFHENGQLEENSFWNNNKLHGECKEFYENGKLWKHSLYENGIKVKDLMAEEEADSKNKQITRLQIILQEALEIIEEIS